MRKKIMNDATAYLRSIAGKRGRNTTLAESAITDGRAFSQAWLIRRRLRFAGDIRATGDVLVDQLVQMQRSGFSSAVLKDGKDPAKYADSFKVRALSA